MNDYIQDAKNGLEDSAMANHTDVGKLFAQQAIAAALISIAESLETLARGQELAVWHQGFMESDNNE